MESGPQGERELAEPLLADASAVVSLDLEDVLKYDFSIYCTKALPTDLKNANGVCLLCRHQPDTSSIKLYFYIIYPASDHSRVKTVSSHFPQLLLMIDLSIKVV